MREEMQLTGIFRCAQRDGDNPATWTSPQNLFGLFRKPPKTFNSVTLNTITLLNMFAHVLTTDVILKS